MKRYAVIVIVGFIAFGSGIVATRAAQTNYLGTIFVADPTTPTHQMVVNADGSINVACH